MSTLKMTVSQAEALRTAVEARWMLESVAHGPSPFFAPGGVPPAAPAEPDWVVVVRSLVPSPELGKSGSEELDHEVGEEVLSEFERSLVEFIRDHPFEVSQPADHLQTALAKVKEALSYVP